MIGGSLVVSALIFGIFFYNSRANSDFLSVTGQAQKQVAADMAKWQSSFSRTVTIKASFNLN